MSMVQKLRHDTHQLYTVIVVLEYCKDSSRISAACPVWRLRLANTVFRRKQWLGSTLPLPWLLSKWGNVSQSLLVNVTGILDLASLEGFSWANSDYHRLQCIMLTPDDGQETRQPIKFTSRHSGTRRWIGAHGSAQSTQVSVQGVPSTPQLKAFTTCQDSAAAGSKKTSSGCNEAVLL